MKLLFVILVWLYCVGTVASNEYPSNGNPLVDGVVLKRYIVVYPYFEGSSCLQNCFDAFSNCLRFELHMSHQHRFHWFNPFHRRFPSFLCGIVRRGCAVKCKGKFF